MKPVILLILATLLLAPLATLGAADIAPRVATPTAGVTAKQVGKPPQPHFNPANYGAKADGVTYDTEAIQKAIDACAGTGGSVVLASGRFLTKPLKLRAGMTLHLQRGAVLLGSPNLADYPVELPKNPPVKALCRSLLYAVNADGLTIDGEGEINGQCQAMNMPAGIRKGGTESARPSVLRVFNSRDVTVKGITFRNPCMWTQIYSECDRLLIEGVKVDAPPDCANLDGMDICDSHDVIIRGCDVRSEDDSICLKSHLPRGLKNILIESNRVHCYRANAIKLGSATVGPVSHVVIRNNQISYAKYAGLNLASVDGSVVTDILVQDIEMHHVGQPVFVRLGRRGKPGSIDGITIERVRAYETNPENGPSCSIAGIPLARIKNVRIKDCYFEMPGGLKGVPGVPAEKENGYPQSNMFWNTPGYAFFVRHADGVVFENVTVSRVAPDIRTWLCAVDAEVKTLGCRNLGHIQPAPSSK